MTHHDSRVPYRPYVLSSMLKKILPINYPRGLALTLNHCEAVSFTLDDVR